MESIKRLLLVLIYLYFNMAYAEDCIAITNKSDHAIEFDTNPSSGAAYTVYPNMTITLTANHMRIACDFIGHEDVCDVTAVSVYGGPIFNFSATRGSQIIYTGDIKTNKTEKNAHVQCSD